MLASDSMATKPAAAAASAAGSRVREEVRESIGAAFSRMPMPAVTLKHSTTHSSQNCGVWIALRAETFALVISDPVLACAGSQPAGRQPARGHADEQPRPST